MRADQLRLSAYEVHVLRSVLRDWRESNLIPTTPIPHHELDALERRLDRIDVDAHEALARSQPHGDYRSIGLGAPGDLPDHHPAPQAAR